MARVANCGCVLGRVVGATVVRVGKAGEQSVYLNFEIDHIIWMGGSCLRCLHHLVVGR